MLPTNCNIMLSSRTFEETGECQRTEPWFGTRYSEQGEPGRGRERKVRARQ